MLQKIHIQNFRSLKSIHLDLQDVNLLIGPNNSGKSNLLKAFGFLSDIFEQKNINPNRLDRLFYRQENKVADGKSDFTSINYVLQTSNIFYKLEIHGMEQSRLSGIEFIGLKKENLSSKDLSVLDIKKVSNLQQYFQTYYLSNRNVEVNITPSAFVEPVSNKYEFTIEYDGRLIKSSKPVEFGNLSALKQTRFDNIFGDFYGNLTDTISHTKVYAINVSSLKLPYPTLENDYSVNADVSNLVAFLDNMRDAYPQVVQSINQSLQACIAECRTIIFEKISLSETHHLRKIYGDKTFKRLGILDRYGQKYWADELSDGTLYLLGLLAIIHQPNPPKLLMLEEPENGIHPRRIKEIVDFIFELSERKGVQVILSTHSTVLIDQFKDLPENVFVFDKPAEYTLVNNLQRDIIARSHEQSEKLNLPKVDLSGSLGDHWASGLIGGVPK
ncbi:MAG: AAA family ATPase [Bacteroidota bacterium]